MAGSRRLKDCSSITVLGVFEAPDDASAAALSLLINSTGSVNVRLKPLLTVEALDEAARKTPSYRAPGQ
ncbi:GYD domain-containing protein [Pseudarthrobacter phenanthrenivorans]|uniref:GYD domain-containing protein n=1 Tax=Pseudarthrobacter phenanthrenivorans TaxID=361575 RepID=UPI001FE53E32|nr:GYD domain-containing protein [Pseudarthrobacter phenanthrenivorans]